MPCGTSRYAEQNRSISKHTKSKANELKTSKQQHVRHNGIQAGDLEIRLSFIIFNR